MSNLKQEGNYIFGTQTKKTVKQMFSMLHFVFALYFLSSCTQTMQSYFQEGNQVNTLPGTTITVEIKLDIQSLNGEWASATLFPEFIGKTIRATPTEWEVKIVETENSTPAPTEKPTETETIEWDVKCSNDCLQLILTNPDSPTVISYVVQKENKWGDWIGSKMQSVIVPVTITVPDDVLVPSTWSGYLAGKIIIAEPMAGGKYGTNVKEVNTPVILHIITLAELESMKK